MTTSGAIRSGPSEPPPCPTARFQVDFKLISWQSQVLLGHRRAALQGWLLLFHAAPAGWSGRGAGDAPQPRRLDGSAERCHGGTHGWPPLDERLQGDVHVPWRRPRIEARSPGDAPGELLCCGSGSDKLF